MSINWNAKLNDSKDLPKYGDSDLALGNYTYDPENAIHVPEFLIKTW